MNQEHLVKLVTQSATEVLERMAFIDIEPKEPFQADSWQLKNEVTAYIQFKGEYSGCMCLCCSHQFTREATANLLGMEEEDLEEAHIIDNIQEMANIIIGNTLCLIDDQRSLAKLDIPKYFKTNDLDITLPETSHVQVIPFEYSALDSDKSEIFFVEIQIEREI